MWSALDVFIGLALCYALLSLICSAIQEFIAQALNSRGNLLVEMFKQNGMSNVLTILENGLAKNPGWLAYMPFGLGKWGMHLRESAQRDNPRAPHDVPVGHFVDAVILHAKTLVNSKAAAAFVKLVKTGNISADAKAALDNLTDPTATKIKDALKGIDLPPQIKAQLESLTDAAVADVHQAIQFASLPQSLKDRLKMLDENTTRTIQDNRAAIEDWYHGFMDQANHWYTRRAQVMSLLIGFVVALLLNANTITISKTLYSDGEKRAAMVALAENVVKDPATQKCGEGAKDGLDKVRQCITETQNMLPIPMGWDIDPNEHWYQFPIKHLDVMTLFGLLLTAIALSLGSRFWFDQLKTLLSLRTGGQPGKSVAGQGVG